MKIKLLSKDALVPVKADKGSAGYDLYVPKDTTIYPGRNIVPIDIALELECEELDENVSVNGHIRPRSGFSAKGIEGYPQERDGKFGIVPCRFNADVIHGTVDSSYRGNVGVIIKSYETEPFLIRQHTRIAQLIIEYIYQGELTLVKELSTTSRGNGGFGHSGAY